MRLNEFTKWFMCWVAWTDETGKEQLSIVPWHILLLGIFGITGSFQWQWVPPWQIKIGH